MNSVEVKPKPHLQQVDYIRAIASLAVALFHLGGKVLPVLKYGWLGVQMFFLLSGFIICWSIPKSYTWKLSWRFISKRIIRIEPPYIISIVLAIAVKYVLVSNYHPDWLNIFGHFAYLNNFSGRPYLNPVYWTLGIEFQFYIFIALLFPVFKQRWGAWLLPVFCLLYYVVAIPGTTLLGVFPVFALGMLYYQYKSKVIMPVEALFLGVFIAVCLVLQSGWLVFAATAFALAILMLPLKSNRLITFLSKISFSLYLTHDIIGSNLVVLMGQHLPKTILFKGIEFTTGIAVSLCFAWLFYLCIEAPFLKFSKRITYSQLTPLQSVS